MTPEEARDLNTEERRAALDRLARARWGDRWTTKLAHAFGYQTRTPRYWMTDATPPAEILVALAQLARSEQLSIRLMEMQDRMAQLADQAAQLASDLKA